MKTYETSPFKRRRLDIKRRTPTSTATAHGSMLVRLEGAKRFYDMYVLNPKHAAAHGGDIHIHDLDFLTLTPPAARSTCCSCSGRLSTGHVLQEPRTSIPTSPGLHRHPASQNDQRRANVVSFDYGMAPGVRKTYRKRFRDNVGRLLTRNTVEDGRRRRSCFPRSGRDRPDSRDGGKGSFDAALKAPGSLMTPERRPNCCPARKFSKRKSQGHLPGDGGAGAQPQHHEQPRRRRCPFPPSITARTPPRRTNLVMEQLLLATEAGLGREETPIFPIQIFRVKASTSTGDPNYDLFAGHPHSANGSSPTFPSWTRRTTSGTTSRAPRQWPTGLPHAGHGQRL